MFDYNQKPDLNITPLVDIMLVLLAILMVTAPVIEFEEPINLPKGSASQQIQAVKKIDILITKDRVVKVNKKNMNLTILQIILFYMQKKKIEKLLYI